MSEKKSATEEQKPFDPDEAAATNPKVDKTRLHEAEQALQALAGYGIAMQQFNLVLPFTRTRSAAVKPSRRGR